MLEGSRKGSGGTPPLPRDQVRGGFSKEGTSEMNF